ncbi:MAG: flagellar biosynthetic protein FliO [Planctomycetota bacterium]
MARIDRHPGAAGAATRGAPALVALWPPPQDPVPSGPATPPLGEGPSLEDLPAYGDALLQMLIVLAILVGVLYLAGRFLPALLERRRPRSSAGGGKLEIIETLRLEPRKTLYLVRMLDDYVLLGATEGQIVNLTGRTTAAGAGALGPAFADVWRDSDVAPGGSP